MASAPTAPNPYQVAGAQQGLNVNTSLAQRALNQYEEVSPYGRSYYEPTGNVTNVSGVPGGGQKQSGFMGSLGGGSSLGGMLGGFGGLGGGSGGMSGTGGKGQQQSGYDIPEMRRVTEFSPEQQKLYEAQTGIQTDLANLASGMTGRVAEGLKEPFSYEGMPAAPEADAAARQQVIDSLYGQYTSRLDPQFERDRAALEQRLINQGISKDSDAYRSEMERFGRTRNDAYTSALNQSILAGGQEQSRLFGLQGSARERAIQEAAYLRDRPLSELTSLMSGNAPTLPQFSATPQTGINPADLQGAVYNSYAGQLDAYKTAEQARASMIGSLAGMGGSLLSGAGAAGGFGKLFSDKRLKENIQDTGISVDGIPIKTWEWRGTGEPDAGVIAQDVQRRKPHAVSTDKATGFKQVNYGKVFGIRGV